MYFWSIKLIANGTVASLEKFLFNFLFLFSFFYKWFFFFPILLMESAKMVFTHNLPSTSWTFFFLLTTTVNWLMRTHFCGLASNALFVRFISLFVFEKKNPTFRIPDFMWYKVKRTSLPVLCILHPNGLFSGTRLTLKCLFDTPVAWWPQN